MSPDRRPGRDRPRGAVREPARRSGRHPKAQAVVVRLTDAAVDDLQAMLRAGSATAVKWALKKMLMLERDPECGQALHGTLAGWRKLVVGDRDWRVVWRATWDNDGAAVVDIAEVWAVGARSEAEVYQEMAERAQQLRAGPQTTALIEVIERLGKAARDVQARPEPAPIETVPRWLHECLVHVVGLDEVTVDQMTPDQAQARWNTYISAPR